MRDEQGRLIIDEFSKNIRRKNTNSSEKKVSEHEQAKIIRQKLSQIKKARQQSLTANKKGPIL